MGFIGEPLGFTPRERCGWNHRFDDPKKEYRTIYCTEKRITCFRETLHGFRPSTKALKEFQRVFGKAESFAAAVPTDWLDKQALAPGRIEIQRGRLFDVDDPVLRRDFEVQHAELLDRFHMDHLDISQVRSRNRLVTQTLSRFVFDQAGAGLLYRSDLDDQACVALFENRARVTADGDPEPLTDHPAGLLKVCKEFGLEKPKRA